jgi:two-component system response regulator NreC
MRRRVLIADDHHIVRAGLRSLLEKAGHLIVGEASNGHDAINLCRSESPDIAVLDLVMPLLNGVDTTRELVRVSPTTRSILLTMHTDRPYVLEAMRAGARGYVLKTQAPEDLIRAVDEVAHGSIYISPGVAVSLVDALLDGDSIAVDPLTPRECRILQLVAEGKTTKEVGRLLNISYKTAESHRSRIMKKLDIHDVAGLVRYAIRRGMVQA